MRYPILFLGFLSLALGEDNVRGSNPVDRQWGEHHPERQLEGNDTKQTEIHLDVQQCYSVANPRLAIRAKRGSDEALFFDPRQTQNGDRLLGVTRNGVRYSIGVFSKTMVHNEFGEVLTSDFRKLEKAMATALQGDMDDVPRNPLAVRKFASPQGAFATSLTSPDSWGVPMKPSPRFQSLETAYEMVYDYGMALLRDVPFYAIERGYSQLDYIVRDLIDDLNEYPEYFFGKLSSNGLVDRVNLFRGFTDGEQYGPVVSQYLLHDFGHGNVQVEQLVGVEVDRPISVSEKGWLDIQNGLIGPSPRPKYPRIRMCNWRAVGSYVHNDPPCSAFTNAVHLLKEFGAPLSPNMPKLKNEDGFVTFGIADLLSAVNEVCQVAFKAAWRQKWSVNLRLRPEVFAGRVHFTLTKHQRYGIHPFVLKSRTLGHVRTYNKEVLGSDSYFLPLMFTEGSPTHPAFPAGHAVVSGAAATVVKAYFDDSVLLANLKNAEGKLFEVIESVDCNETYDEMLTHPIKDPRVLERITVGSELDKLANNIATGRCSAGVHYMSDGHVGVKYGEKLAVRFLSDRATSYNENFAGFTFKQFDDEPAGIEVVNYNWPPPTVETIYG